MTKKEPVNKTLTTFVVFCFNNRNLLFIEIVVTGNKLNGEYFYLNTFSDFSSLIKLFVNSYLFKYIYIFV